MEDVIKGSIVVGYYLAIFAITFGLAWWATRGR
jgi:hypothetical protein